MTPYQIKKDAEESGISIKSAMLMRRRFLYEELSKCSEYTEGELDEIPLEAVDKIVDELLAYLKMEKSLKKAPHKNEITPDMLAQAKAVPIDSLIEFKHGKAICFAHDDKSPSMYVGTKTNTARCPVCNKAWDSIQILIDRDSHTFATAIRKLCNL